MSEGGFASALRTSECARRLVSRGGWNMSNIRWYLGCAMLALIGCGSGGADSGRDGASGPIGSGGGATTESEGGTGGGGENAAGGPAESIAGGGSGGSGGS